MDELMDLYRKTAGTDYFPDNELILKKHNFSETQWLSFLDLVEDLELEEEGIRILLDEIVTGNLILE